MHRSNSIVLLVCLSLLLLFLTQCASSPHPRVYTQLEKTILDNTIADSCVVEFDSNGKTIEVLVINPQRIKSENPLWRDVSLAALQVMYSMEREHFALYDSVGVEYREVRNDSFRDFTKKFHTRTIMLADYIFRIGRNFIGGNGTISVQDIRQFFDPTFKDDELLTLDSLIESGPFFRDPARQYAFNGFLIGYSKELKKDVLVENLSVVTEKWVQEYRFIIDLDSGLILGCEDWTEDDEYDPDAPMVYPQ